MEIRQLKREDASKFSELIIDMYSHLENLEWFSPMPYDIENVTNMIEKPRFYIVGLFDGDTLCGVSSLDYKCGKLIGKIDFPQNCDTDKLVEIGFTMVHSAYKGNGYMKVLVDHLLEKIKNDGFEWAFGKVHKNNLASSTSLIRKGFEIYCDYVKPVSISDFVSLSSQDFFSKIGKENAKKTLSKYKEEDTEIIVDYNILMKKIG